MTTAHGDQRDESVAASNPRRRRAHILLIVENVALARDHRLQKQTATLLSHGYRVSVICRRDPGNREYGASVYQYRAPADARTKLGFLGEYGYSWAMAALLTLKVFIVDPFDAVQVSGTPDIYFTIGAPFRLLGRPLVLDQRDLSPDLYEVRYGRRRGIAYRILCWLERVSYRTADHVITVNGSLEQLACQRAGLARGSVTVVGNGPVLDKTHPRPPSIDLKRGRRYLCCWLGMMGPQDRVELAIRAVDHLVHVIGRTDCHFAFVGDGETRGDLAQLCDDLALGDWVSFPGWAREDEAFRYLSTADLGLEPNLEEIVSPVKGMEYMAFGLPFVAFELKETRVLAEHAAAYAPPGDVVAFAELIHELLGDPKRRAAMGRAGRRSVATRVAWDRQEDAYLSVYERLLPHTGTDQADRPRRARCRRPGLRRASPRCRGGPIVPAQSSVTAVGRARHRLRTHVSEHPMLYLSFARHKYPGPSPEVIGADTELVIDGYTRSATTFAVYAFQLSQHKPVRLAHHLHAPAQLIRAARTNVPALLLIREPQGAVLSQLVREPDVALRDALVAYCRFYTCLLPFQDGFVVGEFEDVTGDFGSVIGRINARFGTDFSPFVDTEETRRECMDLIKLRGTLSGTLLGFESGTVTREQLSGELPDLMRLSEHVDTREAWVPSGARDRSKDALREQWMHADLAGLRERAQELYRRFTSRGGRDAT